MTVMDLHVAYEEGENFIISWVAVNGSKVLCVI
jgi:hypothetical protein